MARNYVSTKEERAQWRFGWRASLTWGAAAALTMLTWGYFGSKFSGSAGPAGFMLSLAVLQAGLTLALERALVSVMRGDRDRGAALLAGVGSGVYADVGEAVARAVHVRKDVEVPDPVLVAAYDDLYLRFVRLYPALTGSGAFE